MSRGRIAKTGALIAILALAQPARADPGWRAAARFASGAGFGLFLGVAAASPLAEGGAQGRSRAWRVVDALGISWIACALIKQAVPKERPDRTGRDSFPSGHAALSFAAATMEAVFHPRQAPLWYAGATAITASRVALKRHHAEDAIAGAGIGALVGRWELGRPPRIRAALRGDGGLLIMPVIGRAARGIALSARF